MNTNPYEATVRTFTVFFSAVTGLGLKELLGHNHFNDYDPDKVLCFAATLLLVLRFLFGSANHLWLESSKRFSVGNFDSSRMFLWHLFCLVVFFGIIMLICYSVEVGQFLRWNIAFGAIALLFVLVGWKSSSGMSWPWFWINLSQAVLVSGLLFWHISVADDLINGWREPLLVMVGIFILFLAIDVWYQVKKLEAFAKGRGT